MSNWELFKLLCRIIAGQPATAPATAVPKDAFPRLVKLADEYDLLPALAVRLNERQDLVADIPAEITDQLQQALKENTAHKLQMVAQAVKVARVLNAAGIEPMFLKGTSLLLGESQVPAGFRKQVDIDLLVAPELIGAACEALKADGYFFYDFDRPQPECFSDTTRAQKLSAHHHHLPPLGKQGYNTLLELHKEPLPRRFQKQLNMKKLLQTAIPSESHGAKFLVPPADMQLVHLVLGTFVNDSFITAYDFPIRAGHDYLQIVNQSSSPDASKPKLNKEIQIFEQLLVELMGLPEDKRLYRACDVRRRLRLMERRFNYPAVARLLKLQARWRYLSNSLWYDGGKLPAYLQRKLA